MVRACLRVVALLLVAAIAAATMNAPGVGAVLSDSTTSAANSISTDELSPATGLQATGGLSIRLDWTATPDSYAAGYRVYRKVGTGAFVQVGAVTPRTATTFTDSTGLSLSLTYQYYVVAYFQNWNSTQTNTVTCVGALTVFVC